MPPVLLIDPTELALMPILASREEIMQVNLQRFEMIQLDGIVLLDPSRHTIGGYKDVGNGEFWVRGHMPGYPLLPGVLICEAAPHAMLGITRRRGPMPKVKWVVLVAHSSAGLFVTVVGCARSAWAGAEQSK